VPRSRPGSTTTGLPLDDILSERPVHLHRACRHRPGGHDPRRLRAGATVPPLRHRWLLHHTVRADAAARVPAFERGNPLNEDGVAGNKSVLERIQAPGGAYQQLDAWCSRQPSSNSSDA
jgi:hypothetical protein